MKHLHTLIKNAFVIILTLGAISSLTYAHWGYSGWQSYKRSYYNYNCVYYTGSVIGHVFEDKNKDDDYNRWSDLGLKNIKIKLTDQYGKTYYTTTNEWGYYKFCNVRIGSAKVEIVKDSLPEGAYQVYGTDPSWVNVYANCQAWAGRDGYAIDNEDLGSICGHVFEDVNKNNKWNKNKDKGLGGVKIKVTAENGDVLYATTDEDGWYTCRECPCR